MQSKPYKFIMKTIRPYLFMEVLGGIITILYAITVFVTPMASKYIIDNVMNKQKHILYYGILIIFCFLYSSTHTRFTKRLYIFECF